MRQQAFYPAVFQPEAEGGYTVTFPDLEGAVTYGADMEEAYKMATEVLGMTLVHFDETKKEIPAPSAANTIALENNQFTAVVAFNLLEYRKRYDSKAVSKNCTIPSWMNTLAMEQNINFSQVLQEALTERLRV